MEIKIGAKIAELRKAKGMTQEQLALALGISAPAVSKWETGGSYPDITMLCPLARVLATNVDTLLEYEEVLSEEKIKTYVNEIIETERMQGVVSADEKLQKLLCQYPNSIPLKFHSVAMFTFFQVQNPDCPKTQKTRWETQKKELLEEIYTSKDASFLHPAISALAVCALRDGELGKAEKYLKELPEDTEDVTVLWIQLYLRKGDKERASKLLQKKLFILANQILSYLSMMIEKVESNHEKALKLCELYKNMEEVFALGGKSSEIVYALTYHRAGYEKEAEECVVRYLERCLEEMPDPNPLLFSPTIKRTASGRNISKEMILRGLLADEEFAKICEKEEVQCLIKQIREYDEKNLLD